MAALSKKITTVVVGLTVSAAVAGCATANEQGGPSSSTSTPSAAPSGTSSDEVAYRDGEYSADGEYGSQDSSIGVTVTLDGDVIADVSVTPHATNETSLGFQRRFAEAVPALVTGRDIDDVALDRVAGNSGTPQGFNDALERIKTEAAR
ncbi:hypothetical protein ACFV9D_31890 [Streptomyces sp. NPDC059875]|uniref:hypothetical protein n=1 Tax=unclassified Streptomyces TaxID=2593676 RepID=UPI003663685B